MSSNKAICIENLTKVYNGSPLPALDDVSLCIPAGETFGLLGPNGAGKTTTINLLCHLIQPSSGKIIIDGLPLNKELKKIKKIIGLVPQDIALYCNMTARENLQFIGNMYGLKGKHLKERIDTCLNLLGLEKSANRLVKTYSGGMKRRINLIAGLLHEPRILFLDEPTVGIDVQSRTVIIEHLRELNKAGTTIIYTSHHMEEAESLCSSIAIIDYGKIIIQGKPSELINQKPEYTDLESIFLHLTGRKLRDN
jgi:ABC-2 type transport system ATP-binding protein